MVFDVGAAASGFGPLEQPMAGVERFGFDQGQGGGDVTFSQTGIAHQNNWLGFAEIVAVSQFQNPLFVKLGDK